MIQSFNIETALQVLLGGLATGALYAVILVGVLLVFHVSKNINFAYGQTGVIASFGSFYLYSVVGLPVWLAVALAIFAAIIVAALTDLLLIRRLSSRPGMDFVVTLGLLLLLSSLAELLFGTSAQSYLRLLSDVSWVVSGVFVNANDLLAIAIGFVVITAGHLLLTRTALGISIRAAAEDPDVAQSAGIAVPILRTSIWAASGLLVALAAMMFASRISVSSFYMTPIIVNVFVAGMIGGLDRYWVPIGMAVFIAVYQAFATYVFGEAGGVPALFLLIIGILSLVPKRLLDERHEARA
jgi:branched-chain amino acid transport system permease protein